MVTPPFLWAAAGLVFGVLVGFLVSRSRSQALYELEKAESKDEASRESLDDDLSIGWKRQAGMPAGHAFDRVAAIGAHHVELAHALGGFGGRCKKR